jgi:hypothetical protein
MEYPLMGQRYTSGVIDALQDLIGANQRWQV